MESRDTTLDTKRVNNVSSVPLDSTTEHLLSRGPKFSITPTVNDSLIRDVERSVERFAYGKRWSDKILSDREERANRELANTRSHSGDEHNEADAAESQVPQAPEADVSGAAEDSRNSQAAGLLLNGVRFPDTNKRQPPPSTRQDEEKLSQLKSSIIKIYKNEKNVASNTSKEEKDALKALRDNDDIIVKPSDKCKGFVIMDKQDYIDKAHTILTDQENYERLEKDITPKVEAKIKRSFKQTVAGKLPDKLIDDFTPRHSRTPVFYGLPKDHKLSVPLRPVVSNCGGPTEKTSILLEKILHQLIQFVPLHLTDTTDFLDKLREFWNAHDVPENAIFFSVDVVNLYGSIPLDDAVEAVREALENHVDEIETCGLSVDEICSLLEQCLTNNVFRFGDEFYLQKQGVAMGNPVAPMVAILFMDRFETLALQHAPRKPAFLVRYIDDFAGVWLDGKESLDEFVSYLNGIDSRIQFTSEMTEEGEGSVPMLDTLITLDKEDGLCKYSTELYIKPNNAGIILHYKSAHPKQTKVNLVRSQFQRAVRLSSSDDAKERSLDKITNLLKKNGYPKRLLGRVRRETLMAGNARRGRRDGGQVGRRTRQNRANGDDLTKGNFLTLPYVNETVLCKVKKAVKKSKLNVRLGWYAPNTLKKSLVTSQLTSAPCPAGVRSCQTCVAISGGRCTDKNVVYEVRCEVCGNIYIGESKRPVRLRFNEHVRSMLCFTENTPLGDHFRNKHPNMRDRALLSIKILKRTLDHPDRKITESLYIREKRPSINENIMSWPLLC